MKILFGGDVCFSYLPESFAYSSFSSVVDGVKPLFEEADASVVNLECVLPEGPSPEIPKSGPALYGDPRSVAFLEELKVSVAGLANNHTGDRGYGAIQETLSLLRSRGIASVGAGNTVEEAYRSQVLEKEGVRVSVLAVCENEFGTAKDNAPGSAGFDLYRLADRIREEKQSSHHVVVFFHGGNEENPFPSPEKTKLYRFLVDLGASAVIACHTHCPQGYELYHGAPIVYSMGNFYFPSPSVPADSAWNYGYLSMLDFTENEVALLVHPYYSYPDGSRITLLEGENEKRFRSYLSELCAPLSEEKRIRELFDVWTTIFGVRYAKHVVYVPEMLQAGPRFCTRLKNVFSCEAHNELIHTLMELCYENRFEEAKKKQDQITRYQKLSLPNPSVL